MRPLIPMSNSQDVNKSNYTIVLLFSFIFLIFVFCIWFCSDITRAAHFDRYLIYAIDDCFRFSYIKQAVAYPVVLLNPYLKIGYGLVNAAAYALFPFGISTLRMVNAFFSLATLILLYKYSLRIGLSTISAISAVLLTSTFPPYFLDSIAALPEILFCFVLLLALYCFYEKKYFLSSLIISFLPAFRNEGVFFLFLWFYFLVFNRRFKYIILLPIPFLIWAGLNNIILNHSLFYTFICNLPDIPPPDCIASGKEILYIYAVLVLHPLCFLGIVGAVVFSLKKAYKSMYVCFFLYFLLLLAGNIFHLIDVNAYTREIRFLVPLTPFLGISAAALMDRYIQKVSLKRGFCVLMAVVLPIIMVIQIFLLQKDKNISTYYTVSATEEEELSNLGEWLSSYISSEHITGVYIPGAKSIHRFYRRLWMYLPGSVKYYSVIGKMESYKPEGLEPLNMGTYVIKPFTADDKGILVLDEPIEMTKDSLHDVEYEMVKTVPSVSMYIYLMNKKE